MRAQAIAVDLTKPILVVDDYSTMIRITHYIVKPFNAQTLKNNRRRILRSPHSRGLRVTTSIPASPPSVCRRRP